MVAIKKSALRTTASYGIALSAIFVETGIGHAEIQDLTYNNAQEST